MNKKQVDPFASAFGAKTAQAPAPAKVPGDEEQGREAAKGQDIPAKIPAPKSEGKPPKKKQQQVAAEKLHRLTLYVPDSLNNDFVDEYYAMIPKLHRKTGKKLPYGPFVLQLARLGLESHAGDRKRLFDILETEATAERGDTGGDNEDGQ